MSQRLVRLVGVGVPITDAFQAVVEEIIDNGPANFDTLNKRVQSAMYLKEKRILSAGWRTWPDFTRDILDQISGVDSDAVPTLQETQGKWAAIEFTRGVAYTAIPNENPKARVTYTVWDEETRLKRDTDARMQMDVRRVKGEVQAIIDRYSAGDVIDSHLKNVVGRLTSVDKVLSGTLPDTEDDEPPRRVVRVPQPKPDVVRGEAEWQRLTGCQMRYPVKDVTIELATMMSRGSEITLPKMAQLVNNRINHIELHLPEPLGKITSGTVLQALQGKDGHGGLVGDKVIERLEGTRPTTFRRL
jgi:hypothetical protein